MERVFTLKTPVDLHVLQQPKIWTEIISHILHNEFLSQSLKLLASLRIICPGKNNNKINVLLQNPPQHACQYLLYINNLTL